MNDSSKQPPVIDQSKTSRDSREKVTGGYQPIKTIKTNPTNPPKPSSPPKKR